MEYKLVVAGQATDLTKKVNTWLQQGWQLYGDPLSDDDYLYQAVTRGGNYPPTPFNTLPGQIGGPYKSHQPNQPQAEIHLSTQNEQKFSWE